MPSAANWCGEVERQYSADNSPIRRMVEILQGKIASLERQKGKLASGGKGAGESKGNCSKVEELNQMLEFVWDICKQAMGIAILSENEAKKQARKESIVRKNQDGQLVRQVLLVLDCLEQLSDPTARQDFLSGTGGASRLTEEDLRVLDDIYPEVTPKHCPEESEPSFQDQTSSAAKHLVAIIDGSPKDIIGSTYGHIKKVVDSIHDCGYLDNAKDTTVGVLPVVEVPVTESEPTPEEPESFPPHQPSPPTQAGPPPPAPQAVPTPTFPILPPNAPPVTLQQVEHAYFAQQYGHQQKPPIPEVFSPFIFLQESEIDTPEPVQQTSPRPVTPNSIPSQTYTNQNFSLPGQHCSGSEPRMPPLPPGANHMPVPGYPPPLAVPHMAMPHGQPPAYQQNPPYTIDRVQPPAPTPPNPMDVPPPHQDTRISPPPQHNPQDTDYSEWNPQTTNDNKTIDNLEIDEWNAPSDSKNDPDSEGGNYSEGQSGNKYRSRGRGGRSNSGGNYRGRGGYQNGGRTNGNFYRNDSYQNRSSNMNGDNRDKNENSQGSYQQGGYKGSRGNFEGRGSWSRRDGATGNAGTGKGGAPKRGGPPREGSNRGQYQRKGPNTQFNSESRGSESKQYSQ